MLDDVVDELMDLIEELISEAAYFPGDEYVTPEMILPTALVDRVRDAYKRYCDLIGENDGYSGACERD